MSKDNNLLKYGDCICLSASQGFLLSQGFTKTACFIQVNFTKSHTYQRNMRDFVFQVLPRMNYDAFKEYSTFKKYFDKASGVGIPGGKSTVTQQDKLKMGNLNKKLAEESNLNRKLYDRRRGEHINYGEEIQLLHYDSKSFLEGSKNCSEIDKSCNLVRLNAQGSKMVCFIVEPRYKYRNEGSPVNYGDVVVFRNMKSNQYLHISTREVLMPKGRNKDEDIQIKDPSSFKNIVYTQIDRRMLPDEFAALYEVNTASNRSNFTIRPYRTYEDEQAINTIKGGQVVRFQHSESQGYICSDDNDFTGDNLAEVFLWNFKGKSSDIEAMSTQTFFELEIVDQVDSGLGQKCQYSGNSSNETAKSGGMHFRIRHLNTGRLVVMQEIQRGDNKLLTVGLSEHLGIDFTVNKKSINSKVHLATTNYEYMQLLDQNSIFRLVSTGVDMESGITSNTSVQIQHVASRRFLQQNHKYKFEVEQEEKDNEGQDVGGDSILGNENLAVGLQTQNTGAIKVNRPIEQLDERYFKKIDDAFINLGSRDMLTLEEHASFENAFFIAPESRENLSKVLFVHTSVNCLNNLLAEICRSDFGQSKDRQNKIENIIHEMIAWLVTDDEEELDGDVGKFLMDIPYSLKSNDEFARKERALKVKQKNMRELRVIECIADILYMPFACGAWKFEEITQDLAITNLIRLCYQLLSLIVKNYRLNEMYTSQWIGLFLSHVLRANDYNAVGADDFVSQLCDENDIILEQMITSDVIEQFIKECDKGKEAPRLLQLLTALCASKNGPIIQNQLSVVRILCDDQEQREKLLMPIRRLKRRYEIEVCLDLKQERWVPIVKVGEQYKQIMKKHDRALQFDPNAKLSAADEAFLIDYQCFTQILDMFAETCLHRNKENQKRLSVHYESKLLILIFQDARINNKIRSKALKLYLEACLDIDPFQKLQVPSGQAVWKDLPQISSVGQELLQAVENKTQAFDIKSSKVKIPKRMIELKLFMQQYLESVKGIIDPSEEDKNAMTIAVLRTVSFMVMHGFYQNPEELAKIATPIVLFLNGGNSTKKKQILEANPDPDYEESLKRQRYFPDDPSEALTQSKCLAAEILLLISNLESDAKCNVYLAKLKKDIEIGLERNQNDQIPPIEPVKSGNKVAPIQESQQVGPVSCAEDLKLLQVISAVKGYESVNEQQYVCVLFDLMLYRYTDLQSKAFAMLVNYFTRKRIMIENLSSTQILESSKSIHTMNEIKKSHVALKKQYSEIQFWLQKHNHSGNQAKEEVTRIFEKLTKFCVLKEPEQVADQDSSDEQNISHSITKSNKRNMEKEKLQKEKKSKLEEFMLFDIDKINATPNRENQRLLQSFNIAEIALAIIKQRVDRITNSNEYYKELIKSCYRFLTSYVRNNFQNQLKVYDDVDVFMRDMDTYQVATLLFYEIFKDNTKFLTLNVTKFIRTINNTAEEVSLNQVRKAIYLKLLEVFCRFERQLIRQNQIEIIVQMTSDTSRSNVLYLFQPEGAKELSVHVAESLEIKKPSRQESFKNILKMDFSPDRSQTIDQMNFTRGKTEQTVKYEQTGTQVMCMPIFNVIQLLQLVSLCTQGKSDYAEMKCKESILNFKAAANMIKMSEDFWPLKIAVFNYIINCYMECSDPSFMAKPDEDNQAEEEEVSENVVDDSDVGVLLRLIEILNKDFEDYLENNVRQTKLQMPNGKSISMKTLNETYIFGCGFDFIKATLKRKTYDVGSVELKFYVLAKHVAATFYHTTERKNQIAALELLKYIHGSDRHAKYLDNVKHPAKKGRQNREVLEALGQIDSDPEDEILTKPELTNSNRLSQRITQLANSYEMKLMKEEEFTELVTWVSNVGDSVKKIMGKGDNNPFSNVTQINFIGSLLRLLDARVLTKELQITGLSILRKIIEMENKEKVTPSADWNTEDWVNYRRIINIKQDLVIERGTIQFICKHITEIEDAEIQEECLLVCISLVLGGNEKAQKTFFDFMRLEDTENKFLITIKSILMRNFELTKKYMIEKNAKLEMVHKLNAPKKHQHDTSNNDSKEKTKGCFSCFKRRGQKVEEIDQQPDAQQNEELQFTYKKNENSVEKVDEEDDEDNLLAVEISEVEDDDEDKEEQAKVEKPISVEQLEEATKKKYLAMTIRILRFLQLLCEGHYADLQNNLREQVNATGGKSSRSFDFVAYVSNMFTIYVKSYVNCYSTMLGNQIIESLIEFIQGPCSESQRTLVETKAIDCCRDLLNQGMGNVAELEVKGFGGKRKALLNDIKMNSVKLLLSILEGPVDEQISARISASLGDFQIVIKRMESIYYQFLEEELNLPPDAPDWKVQQSLSKDSFDSCILEGFDIFSLLNQLVEVIPEDSGKLDKFRDQTFFKFFIRNSGNIEVNTQFDVLRIYFPLQPKCSFLTDKTKAIFSRTVERESGQHKLLGLCSQIPSFIEEMDHLEVMSHQRIKITPARLNYMRDLSTILAIMVGGVIVTSYKQSYTLNDDNTQTYNSNISSFANSAIFGLGCIQAGTSFMLLVGFIVNSANLIIRAGWRERVAQNEIEMIIEKNQLQNKRDSQFSELTCDDLDISEQRVVLQLEGPYSPVFFNELTGVKNFGGISMQFEYYWISLTFMISNSEFIFNVMYFVFSIQGLLQSPVFYSFHLLDVVNRFPALQNVIKSVTLNLGQILMTCMLGAILIYNFSIFTFLFLSDNMIDGSINSGLLNKNGQSICMSLLHCFFSTITYGLRNGGGVSETLPAANHEDQFRQNYYIRFFFDISFFLVISTIILNVIFGIIIDSFAQLRETAMFTASDIKNVCFMCNLDRYTLDRDTEEGFDFHTQKDHDLWNYVYFIIYLRQKDPSDYNGTESYINSLLDKEDMVWFPAHKSIRMVQTLKLRKNLDVVEEAGELEVLQEEINKFDQALSKLEQME